MAALVLWPLVAALVSQADPLDHWTWRSGLPPGIAFHGVSYGNNQFVAVGNGVATSSDGNAWMTRYAGPGGFNAVTYANNRLVAVGSTTASSADGATWTTHNAGLPQSYVLFAVAYGNERFVAVGGRGVPIDNIIATSTDGTNWISHRSVPAPPAQLLVSVAYGNGQFVAVGQDHGIYVILTSPDGIDWTQRALGYPALNRVIYANGLFVAVGDYRPGPDRGPGLILTSPDGITWTKRTSPIYGHLVSILHYPNIGFVALAANGIAASLDGTTWTGHTWGAPVATGSLEIGVHAALAYGNNTFVVVGGTGAILQSAVLAPTQPVLGPLILLSSAGVRVTLTGQPGQSYAIQGSSDLTQWQTITNLALTNASGRFFDPAATKLPQRFYRAVVQ